MFIARTAVSLRMQGLREKFLVVVTCFVDNGEMIKIYLVDKLIGVLSCVTRPPHLRVHVSAMKLV